MSPEDNRNSDIGFGLVVVVLSSLVVLVVMDMTNRNDFNMSDLMGVIFGVVSVILTINSWKVDTAIRNRELELRQQELDLRKDEIETSRDKDARIDASCMATIRGVLASWLAEGPDYGFPVNRRRLEELSSRLQGIDRECREAHPTIAELLADISTRISEMETLAQDLDGEEIEKRVRQLTRELERK